MPSDAPRYAPDDERHFDAFDRLTWRIGRGMALGVPTWIALAWGLSALGLRVGAVLVLATVLAYVVVEVLERFVMTTARRRRLVTLLAVAAILAWILVIPFVDAAGR